MPKPAFPPDLRVRLTSEWLINHTAIFVAQEGEKPFSAMTAYRIKKRFEAYWQTWIAPELEELIGKPIQSNEVSKGDKT